MSVALARTSRERPEAAFRSWLLPTSRAFWLFIVVLAIVLFALNLCAPLFGAKTMICPFGSGTPCGYGEHTVGALHHAGIARHAFDAYLVILALVDALVPFCLGVLIFLRRSDSSSSWLASMLLVMLGAQLLAGEASATALQSIASVFLIFFLLLCLGFFIVTFPDGRFVPRWSWLAGSSLLVQGLLYQLPGAWNVASWPPPLFVLENLLAFGSPIAIQIYRYVRVSGPSQRQQSKWVIYALVCFVILLIAQVVAEALFPQLKAASSLYPLVSDSLIPSIGVLFIPIGITLAILRSRLYDIDVLINQTLVYGTLTISLAAVYIASVLLLQALLSTLIAGGSQFAIAISTLGIAALFQPLRHRIQDFIDRRFYRHKYDAASTLAAFQGRLRNEVDLDLLSADLLGVVRETVQPDHVSLWLR